MLDRNGKVTKVPCKLEVQRNGINRTRGAWQQQVSEVLSLGLGGYDFRQFDNLVGCREDARYAPG